MLQVDRGRPSMLYGGQYGLAPEPSAGCAPGARWKSGA
jgi:hypothetical protein